jgi:hypothetical protein
VVVVEVDISGDISSFEKIVFELNDKTVINPATEALNGTIRAKELTNRVSKEARTRNIVI